MSVQPIEPGVIEARAVTPGEPAGTGSVPAGYLSPTVVTAEHQIPAVLAQILDGAPVVAVDTETTGLNPLRDRLLLLQLSNGRQSAVFDMTRLGAAGYKMLRTVLETADTLWLAQNAKFDYGWLAEKLQSEDILPRLFDTMVAEQILNGGAEHGGNSLARIAKRYLGYEMDKATRAEFVDMQPDPTTGQFGFTDQQLRYSAIDVFVLPAIFAKQAKKLARANLNEVAKLEFSLIKVVSRMERRGVLIDRKLWTTEVDAAKERCSELEKEMKVLAASESFNPRSPKQVIEAFRKLGFLLGSSNRGTLSKVRHPLAERMLEWRRVAVLRDRYGDSWLHRLDSGSRIHAQFVQLGAATGRFSSRDPNLQQLPRGDLLRKCFIAGPGRKMITADYCLDPATQVLYSDMTWRRIDTVQVGDELVGYDVTTRPWTWKRTKVTSTKHVHQPRYRVVTDKGEVIASGKHCWPASGPAHKNSECSHRTGIAPTSVVWMPTEELCVGDRLSYFGDPWEPENSYEAGYLAGFLDGEGYLTQVSVGFGQKEGLVLDKVTQLLRERGHKLYVSEPRPNGVVTVQLTGQRAGLRLLGTTRPERLLSKAHRLYEGHRTWGRNSGPATIMHIEQISDGEVVGIQTETETFVANGFLSHNSAIEMRVLAEYSGDEKMIDLFKAGYDIHAGTAMQMFRLPELPGKDSKERQMAKSVNFGLVYGAGADNLRGQLAGQGIDVSKSEAEALIRLYFETFPQAKKWLDAQSKRAYAAMDDGIAVMTTTFSGRKRLFSTSHGMSSYERGHIARQCRNTPIQGASADITKNAMVLLDQTFREHPEWDAHLLMTVHDELVAECAEEHVDEVAKVMEAKMIEGGTRWMTQCPVKVDLVVADTWSK